MDQGAILTEEHGWYFEQDGNRHGPIPLNTLMGFYTGKIVSGDTLVWNEKRGGEWVRFSQAQTVVAPPGQQSPPPLPRARPKASSFFAWAIAFIPIAAAIVELALTDGGVARNMRGAILSFCVVAYVAFSAWDSSHIRNRGASDKLPIIWFWLPPVYLYKRARLLRQSLAYFWAWIAAALLALVITNTDLATKDVYWGMGLPSCDSPDIKDKVSELFEEVPIVSLTGGKAVAVIKIRQVTGNDEERSCEASVRSNRNLSYPVTYTLTDNDGDYLIEMQVGLPEVK